MSVDLKPWLQFEARLAAWMRGLAANRLTFRAGRQSIPGFPSDGFRADALLTDGRVLLALEVEVKQTHPDTNVGKYWLLADHHRYEKVILFHIYTPGYDSYGWRKALGEFYACKMAAELPFEYVAVDLRAETDIEEAFAKACAAIGPRVQQELPEPR